MKILLLVYLCYQTMAFAKEIIDLPEVPGQCPTEIKPYTEYTPDDVSLTA